MRRLMILLLVVLLAALGSASAVAARGAAPATVAERGTPGTWTKVSYGTVGISDQASLFRTPDHVLHVVYAKEAAGGAGQLGHTALNTNGSIVSHTDVLSPAWSVRDVSPIVMGDSGGGLRIVFGGIQTLAAGYWSDGRMYTTTAAEAGTTWTLPAAAVGTSHSAYGSYGTAATTLADGTPIAGFPLNSDFTWHVGLDETADASFTSSSCCLYDASMVRDGNDVWVAWYENGSTAATNGTFVKQIYPVVGATMKAPSSSVGVDSLPAGRVALAARTGGGVVAAYCSGYPYCTVKLWKVGSASAETVPGSKYGDNIALSRGPSGRLWLAWSNNLPVVHAVRTGVNGLRLGAVRSIGKPPHTSSIYSVAIEGSSARGDVVVNLGGAFWHTQVLAGLTLRISPRTWRHGTGSHRVAFTVTDAGAGVRGATVHVGALRCTTGSSGVCHLTFPSAFSRGSHPVSASRAGYAAATGSIKVG